MLSQTPSPTSQENVSASSSVAKVGAKSIVGAATSSPSFITTPAITVRGLTLEIREKYKDKRYLILSKGQMVIRTNECDFMNDTQRFGLVSSEVRADGSWKIIVSKRTTRSTLDPEMMEAGEKPEITNFPLETWTVSSTDRIDTQVKGQGVVPVDSGLARPIIVSPEGVILEVFYSAC